MKRTSEGQCKACPNGRYSDIEGVTADTNCKVCTIGKWSNVGGLVADDDCKLCPLGRQGKNTKLILAVGDDTADTKQLALPRHSPVAAVRTRSELAVAAGASITRLLDRPG